MKKQTLILFMAGFLSLFESCKGQDQKQDQPLVTEKLKAGQVWKYHNRPDEDSSTLTILKVEKYEKGDIIIHIRVDGIKLYNPNVVGGYSHYIGHMPFSEKSIAKSITTLVRQNTSLPEFSDGYNQWKEAWDNGKGGYWTVDLKEAIQGMDSVMRQNR